MTTSYCMLFSGVAVPPVGIHKYKVDVYKYKYVYFNFHIISSRIKHANYKAKVEMDVQCI